MDAPRPPALPTATVDDLLDVTTYDFPITVRGQQKVLKLRRLDIFTRFMEESIPQPLFSAAHDAIVKLQEEPSDDRRGEVLFGMPAEERAQIVEMLRRNACLVAIAPRLSMDGAAGTFPVEFIPVQTLLRIYFEAPSVVAPPPVVSGPETFREPAEVGGAGSDGAAVRAEAVELAGPPADGEPAGVAGESV